MSLLLSLRPLRNCFLCLSLRENYRQKMNRRLRIILLTWLLALTSALPVMASTGTDDKGIGGDVWLTAPHQKQQATISDSSQVYRICSSRPGRLIPTLFAKQGQSRKPQLFNFKTFSLSQSQRRGRHHIRLSRLVPQLPCEYYVFALKRLIC